VNADENSTQTEAGASDTSESETTETPDVNTLKSELLTERERFLRLAADFDNFRKRVTQESERRAAVQKKAFIRELLPIIDNLERAVSSGPSTSGEQLLQGVQMTLQQLNRLLRAHGVEPEESVGRPFDPHYHEAIASRYDPSQPDHVILETFQRGYRYGNESLRPAKVVVNDYSEAESSDTQNSGSERQRSTTDGI
jgi:molecular chaperone GrpE